MKHMIRYSIYAFICLALFFPLYAEEGMIPLSEINKLDIKALGFQITPNELYNPNGVSLIDAIINLSGCTASFVSSDGLIMTNYHCAFDSIQLASSKANDYLENGFIAIDRSMEIPAKSFTARVIESYKDVSSDVLMVVKKDMSYAQKAKAIEKKTKEIVVDIEKKFPGRRAEVAEMFIGKTYILFIYTYLKDIRLVYAPPRSIGEFGGEIDNWTWPRHTGDFTFMRAYTAPDGSSADFSSNNIPYHPKKFLQVAPDGVKEDDLVFILGYPGSTYRHRTSYYLSFEEEIRLPFVADLYEWIINVLENLSQKDRSVEIKLSAQLKGLWNTMKRNKAQLKSLDAIKLGVTRRAEEKALQKFIDEDPKRKEKYSAVLTKIDNLFKLKRQSAEYDLILSYLLRTSKMLNNAYTIYEASIERNKKDTDRESAYMDRNIKRTKERLEIDIANYYEEADKMILKELLTRAHAIKGNKRIPAVDNLNIDSFIEKAYNVSLLNDKTVLAELFNKSTDELKKMDDPFMKLAIALYPSYREKKEREKEQDGIQDELFSRLIDVKKEFLGQDFVPDANSTFRLTYGHIRGYSPSDAVYHKPFTTLRGIIEKNTSGDPSFKAPKKLFDLYNAKEFGRYVKPDLNDVPVAMLYNMDTTGGNSGSPVLNAKGQLVGLNFDRVYGATINDFAWNEAYSRSIGVDIRFILWFLDKFGGAASLLKEMNTVRGLN
jgi:hypothetical protein